MATQLTNLAAQFADKKNFEFRIFTEPIAQDDINRLVETPAAFRDYFADLVLRHVPTATKTAASMRTAYVDNFFGKRAEGECALLLHMMQLDSDNWFQPAEMLEMIRKCRVRRSDEQFFVFKGVDNADLVPGACRVQGEVLVTLNQDRGTANVFVPALRD